VIAIAITVLAIAIRDAGMRIANAISSTSKKGTQNDK